MGESNLKINIITDDPYLKHTLLGYFSLHDEIILQITVEPLPESVTDMYVVPAENTAGLFGETSTRPSTWLPVICHGPEHLLGPSYLMACTDFLKDPWPPEELYYRIFQTCYSGFRSFIWNTISFSPFKAVFKGQSAELSKQEYTVFYILKNNQGQTVSRRVLSYALWDRERPKSRAVDMHISALRRKIGGLLGEDIIYTVYREGYMLRGEF